MTIFSSRPPPTILVIYAQGNGDAYVRYLTSAGCRVVSASRSQSVEIVDRTLATMPDLVLVDYGCDGDAVERLKSDRRTAGIPVIALAELPMPPSRLETVSAIVRHDVSSEPGFPSSELTS